MRALLLDARASLQAAPAVARITAAELGRGQDWIDHQCQSYHDLAAGHLFS